jgi:hypothetical protein
MPTLYHRIYYLNKQKSKYVCIYLDADLAPQVKIATCTDSVVLNEKQWSKLVKIIEYKCGFHEPCDSRHNLFMYCGRYIRIKCEKVQVILLMTEWTNLLKLASGCLDGLMKRLTPLRAEESAWCEKCLFYKTYCKPPLIDVIDIKALDDELMVVNDLESGHFYKCLTNL